MGVQKFQDSHSLTAEHYHRHRQQLTEKGIIKKHHAIFIKNNIKEIKNSGKSKFLLINNINFISELISSRFYKLINEASLAFLQHCFKEDIMTFWK
jgi:hypothetical protein